MKRIVSLILLLGLISCQDAGDGFRISGTTENVADGKVIYFAQLDQNNQPQRMDSVTVKNQKFSLDLTQAAIPNLSFLTIDGHGGNVMFISENEPVTFKIYGDSLQASKVSGGEENKVFFDYLNHIKSLNERVITVRNELNQLGRNADSSTVAGLFEKEEEVLAEGREKKKSLIQEHPDKFAAILMVSDLQNLKAPYPEVKEHFEMLSNNIQQTSLAKSLKADLDKRSVTEIGSPAPRFSGPNPQGEEIALGDVMGKVTLIDFWAAWCKPCRDENPNIVRVYEKYHDQGFNIVGVSLDRPGQKDKWLQAIEDDGLTWTHISSLQFWQDPIAQLYGIQAIPAAFILDEDGVIVAKNLRGKALELKVKELLEQ